MFRAPVGTCRFDATNLPSPLFLTDKAHKGYFWNSLPKAVRKDLVEKPYAMENHISGMWTIVNHVQIATKGNSLSHAAGSFQQPEFHRKQRCCSLAVLFAATPVVVGLLRLLTDMFHVCLWGTIS